MLVCRLLPINPFYKIAMRSKEIDSKCVQTFLSCTSKYEKGVYQRHWFTEKAEIDFENCKVLASAHCDELLTTLYGDYMKLPSEEERKIKVHAILVDTKRDYTEYENYRDGMSFDVYTRNIH